MYLVATVPTMKMERLVARWKLEGGLPAVPGQKVNTPITTGDAAANPEIPLYWRKEEFQIPPEGELGPTVQGDADYAGGMVVYNWDTKDIVWRSNWGNTLITPLGICFADDKLYITDMEGSNIFEAELREEPGKLLRRISHPSFNDLHSIERTSRGLLTTCSGTDLIIEVDLNGNSLWEWWASEHGYSKTPSGKERASGRGQEHRDQYYHTRYQATHLNCAVPRDESERLILCLLFHQGQLIEIDRGLPPEEQHGRVVLEGLARPHSLEKMPGGWIFCNSLSKELVLINDALEVIDRIPYDGGWIQDCTRLSNGTVLLNDVDNHKLVEFEGPPWQIVRTTPYDTNWRMGEVVELPGAYEPAFESAQVQHA